jgi:CheY-like chemotaxis protein
MTAQERVVGKSILLVDDQPEVREIIRVLLDIDGHTVTEAGNGREALAQFKAGAFDLVLTDYFMPLMRGDELATRIKELAPAQPILMITGSPTDPGGFAPSADAILCKPFTIEALRAAMAQLLCPAAVH